ncbi:TRL-like family protein [Candidatus Deianiraea vastatrix]|uniref:TRL-family protein n=1 Tax=Candidatus Deianiraea vastatrix TaxID=2163644 RepID=A0A5B8XC41_9RICK|nr:TRL-like family protein [Candidatus Deianiraea vastatrix]QED22919.1 Putative TRL-family protein [Candidatus Deianiraea vastatrix]
MKKIALAISLVTIAGCAQTSTGMSTGLIYNNIKDKSYHTNFDNTVKVSKIGRSCTTGVLGLTSWGDSSIETAKSNGKITKIAFIDKENFDTRFVWLPIYSQGCTVVHGE